MKKVTELNYKTRNVNEPILKSYLCKDRSGETFLIKTSNIQRAESNSAKYGYVILYEVKIISENQNRSKIEYEKI